MSDKKPFTAWLVLGALALGLLFWALEARSDVVTCTSGPAPSGSDCAIKGEKPKATIIGTDLVLWCGSNYPDKGAMTGCTNPLWMRYAQMQATNWVLFDAGWYRLNEAPPDGQAPTPTPTPVVIPKCPLPTEWNQIWHVLDVRNGIGMGWTHCDIEGRIVMNWACVNPQNVPKMTGRINLWNYLQIAAARRNCNAADINAHQEAWNKGERLKAFTAGTGADIPTYFSNADGTLGKPTGGRVKVNVECGWQDRIIKYVDGVKTGTNYYAVVDPSKKVYANCKLDGPLVK